MRTAQPSSTRAVAWAVEQAVLEHRPLVLAHGMGPAESHWMAPERPRPQGRARGPAAGGPRVLDAAHAQVAARAPDLVVHEALRAADPRELLIELGVPRGLCSSSAPTAAAP